MLMWRGKGPMRTRCKETELLPGLDAPELRDILFFALQPPAELFPLIQRIGGYFRREFGLKGALFTPQRLHVSLCGFQPREGVSEALVDIFRRIGDSMAASPFDVVFDRAVSFARNGDKRAFVLRAGGDLVALIDFHRAMDAGMMRAGFHGRSSFLPHLTLLYDGRLVVEHEVETVRWTARDFVLLHSVPKAGQRQESYIELGRWLLQV
jgi:RNA 2',3'-cyclic 3'-phosphodiesterase